MKKLILYLVVLFLLACGNDAGRTFIANDNVSVAGKLSLNGARPENLKVFGILASGLRRPIDNASIDSEGRFSFPLDEQYRVDDLNTHQPIKDALMGAGYNANHLKGSFSSKMQGTFRIEFVDTHDGLNAGILKYNQLVVAFDREQAFSAMPRIDIKGGDGEFTLKEVGAVTVLVKDAEGNTLEGVSISTIPLMNGQLSDLGENPLWNPVTTTTDGLGKTLAYPLPSSGTEPGFQIIARKDGYCPTVTESEVFKASELPSVSIVLTSCDDIEQKPSLKAKFKEPIISSEEDDVLRGYVNSKEVEISLTSNGQILRGFDTFVYEGDKPEGDIFYKSTSSSFADTHQIEVPFTFSDGGENGTFTIVLQQKLTTNDIKMYGEAERVILYGAKSTIKPTIDKDLVTLKSSAGIEDVLSGVAGSSFSLAYESCPEYGQIGLRLPNSNYIYYDCSKTQIVQLDDLDFSATNIGGDVTISFVLKDKYGNITDTTTGLAQKNIYMDYGTPDLSSQTISLGVQFGFAASGVTKGTEDSPYAFGLGTKVTQGTAASLVLRFASPSSCTHASPSLADGLSDDTGRTISVFAVGEGDFVNCGDDISLSSSDFNFPSSASSNATFSLRVRDAAGNESNPFEYEIIPCDGDPASKTFCWE